jgi:hypothetical protein
VSDFNEAPALPPLVGHEPLLDGSVADFWRWALSDLRMNTARGWFAEYLIAQAVGDPRPGRTEWGSYDVESAEGIKIEVKTSGYWQSWAQRTRSSITFGGLWSRKWTPQTGYEPEPSIVADVFVFAVQAALTADSYDPLDLSQWEFYVLPSSIIRERVGKSVGLTTLTQLGGAPIKLDGLRAAIVAAATIAS